MEVVSTPNINFDVWEQAFTGHRAPTTLIVDVYFYYLNTTTIGYRLSYNKELSRLSNFIVSYIQLAYKEDKITTYN